MPFEDNSELSDDNQFKTPQKKSDTSNAGSEEVEQQPKKIPKAKAKNASCKPKLKSQMKRPSSKTEAVEEHGQDDQEEGQEHEKDDTDTVKKKPATKAVEKHGQDDEAAEQGQEPEKDDTVKKRPAGKKPKAAAVMKRPSGPSGVKKERAYMCYYKRDCVFGIKWKGSEVMRARGFCGFLIKNMVCLVFFIP